MKKNKKIPIQNIYYMLAYTYGKLSLKEYKKLGTESFEHIEELYAEILCIGIPVLIQGGLRKDYISTADKTSVIRGKLDINSSIKQNSQVNKKLVVTYDEFSEDILVNRILKATLAHWSRSYRIQKAQRERLLSYLPYFSKVTSIELNLSVWKKVDYDRQNIRYKFLVNICRFLYEELLLNEASLEEENKEVEDEQLLHNLYEKFVYAFYKNETKYSVNRPQICWAVDDKMVEKLPVMKTDIVLKNKNRILIIDTKFYSNNMAKRNKESKEKQISSNLYQIYAYVDNWKVAENEIVGGMLLYAKTTDEIQPDHQYRIKGKSIMVKNLDLNQSFDQIKEDLILLADDYLKAET